jgi:hypothetical protein
MSEQSTIKVSSIKPHPNNPRLIKDDKFEKLVNSIRDFPKGMSLRPIIVDENDVVLGGNMRLKAIQYLGMKEIPREWVRAANDFTEEDKKQFIIKDNVGFGEWDYNELANSWDSEELIEWGMDVWKEEEKETEAQYSRKVEAPIYEPRGEQPPIQDLYDPSKTEALKGRIQDIDIPDEIKAFLSYAANRHTVFNYDRIADFYAHSNPEIKELFEDSALVIIDYNKAIEDGFIQLVDEINNVRKEDEENED